jgi:phage terminase small subunit
LTINEDRMPALGNARHEHFAQLTAEGRSGVDAYLEAGHQVSRKVAGVNASRLVKNPDVKARIAELEEQRAAMAAGTAEAVETLVRELALVFADVPATEGERARRITWLLREGRRAVGARSNNGALL